MSYYNNDLLSFTISVMRYIKKSWLMTIKINNWLSKESIVEYNNSNKKESNDNKLVTITLLNDVLLDIRREMEKEKEMQIQEPLIKMVSFERILPLLFVLREFFDVVVLLFILDRNQVVYLFFQQIHR